VLDFTLTHDGLNWIAKYNQLTAEANTLESLDQKIKNILRENKFVKSGETKRIRFVFDNSTIPQWIRQYSNHYFNRIIEVTG
jgi:hypothetical protein